MHHFIVGALNACASPIKGNNLEPRIFGHGVRPEMRKIFGWDGFLDDEESIFIELMIHSFSRSEVTSVMRIKAFFNDSPKVVFT